jgi:hypothetical protein
MIKKILLYLIALPGILISERTLGQTTTDDTTTQRIALAHVADAYNDAIGQQSRLYNGPEYDLYNPNIKGNAYFSDLNTFTAGTVTYDGIFYKNVPMMYDMFRDVVAVQLYNKFSRFKLLNERVKDFNLFGHHFVYMIADSLNKNSLSAGFYDQLYEGNLEVLAKYSKTMQNTSGINTIETYFTATSTSFYLKKDNNYHSISGQTALLNILKDKKKELQQYIKTNKIKFKKTPSEAMVAIVARYDELSR